MQASCKVEIAWSKVRCWINGEEDVMVPAKIKPPLVSSSTYVVGTGWINGEDDVMVPSLLSRQNAPLVLGSTDDG
jgi:hypothetical protein